MKITRKYKGHLITSDKCSYPTYSSEFYVKDGLIHLLGIKKLKTIKKLIDIILDDEN